MNQENKLANMSQLLAQVTADLSRHEGFREYAYPDPQSPLFLKYPKARWGFKPAAIILEELGETGNEAKGRPWTVGHGFTYNVNPYTKISLKESVLRLEKEAIEHMKGLDKLVPSWHTMPFFAQTVLANMIYNLGTVRLSKFAPTLAVMEQKRWGRAARRLEKTLWYKQTGSRARELCARLLNQKIDPKHLVVKEPHHTIDTGISCKYIGE